MRVLVAVKRVPDPNQRIRVKTDGSGIELAGVRWVMNPYDEVALEQAVRWKESGTVTDIVAASVGGPGCKDVLRSALALGADRAVHVAAPEHPSTLGVANELAGLARAERCDVALLGALAVDDGGSETGPMLAALLDWPQGTRVISADLVGRTAQIERVTDSGIEALEIDLPCVLTADSRLNTPRFANLAAVMRAKKAPIEERVTGATELAPKVISMVPAVRARAGQRVTSARELVAALRAQGAL